MAEQKPIPLDIFDRAKAELNEKGQYHVQQTIVNMMRLKQEKILKKLEGNTNKLLGKEDSKGNVKGGLNSKINQLMEERDEDIDNGNYDKKRQKRFLSMIQVLLIEKEKVEVENKILSNEYKVNAMILGDSIEDDNLPQETLTNPLDTSIEDNDEKDEDEQDDDDTEEDEQDEEKDEDEQDDNDNEQDEDSEENISDDEMKKLLGEENIVDTEQRKNIELKGVEVDIVEKKE